MHPWWFYWTGPAVSMQLMGLLVYALFLRRSILRKYRQHGLTNLVYFDNPTLVYQMTRYPGLHCAGHLGFVVLLPKMWLRRLRSCRDLDRAVHLTHFTTAERLGSMLLVSLLAGGTLIVVSIAIIQIAQRLTSMVPGY